MLLLKQKLENPSSGIHPTEMLFIPTAKEIAVQVRNHAYVISEDTGTLSEIKLIANYKS